jgi:hypothetical protein
VNGGAYALINAGGSGTVASGTIGQPAIYTATGTTVGSSGQEVDITPLSGAHWTDKVATAITQLGSGGGTIVIPGPTFNGDDGSGTTPVLPGNVTLRFTGAGTLTFCKITLGTFSKIYSDADVILQMNSGGSGCTGITHPQTSFVSMQAYDHTAVHGVRINCNGQPGSFGMDFLGSSAQDEIENVKITGCGSSAGGGGIFYQDQFGHIRNVSLWNNYVNLKMYSPGNGGGVSSNSFYDLKTVNPTSGVNVLMATIAPSGNAGMGDNFFFNHQCQNGTIACVAMVGTSTNGMDATWVGADPEVNGCQNSGAGCTNSVTIDGITVPESGAWYTAYSTLNIISIDESDAQTQPGMLITNHSVANISNSGGFGEPFNQSIVGDQTSCVNLQGNYGFAGTVQQVCAWPDIILETYYGALAGSPVSRLDPAIPQAYAGNPLTPTLTTTTGATASTTIDTQYGLVSTCTFAASAGSSSANGCGISNAIPAQGVASNYLFSILVQASANTNVQLGGSFGGTFIGFYFQPGGVSPGNNKTLQLYAGQEERIMGWASNVSGSTPLNLQIFPNDAAGATIKITRLETLAYPTSVANGYAGMPEAGARYQIIHDGAVNPGTAGGLTTLTISSGTATLGTSAVSPGACATVVTVTATGVLTTDNIQADFNADPTGTTGYVPGTSLTIVKYPTAGNVNFKACNGTGSSITPSAVTLNWRVTR